MYLVGLHVYVLQDDTRSLQYQISQPVTNFLHRLFVLLMQLNLYTLCSVMNTLLAMRLLLLFNQGAIESQCSLKKLTVVD